MAGTGGLSAAAREQNVKHLPPIDHRWGSRQGVLKDQLGMMLATIVYGASLIVAAPNCHPWGVPLARLATEPEKPRASWGE